MKRFIIKFIKIIFTVIGSILLLIAIYLMAANLFASVIIEKKATNEPEEVTVYLLSNGAHTDIVVPVKNSTFNWLQYFKYTDTRSTDSTYQYLAIGWGDKGFYMEIPTWNDLTPKIALKAGLGLSTSAIHATFYRTLYKDDMCKKFTLTKNQYKQLTEYVTSYLQFDSQNHIIKIDTDAVYGYNDAFYEAKRSYSIFFTCNTWTNNLLKTCGQKACIWTPFSTPILQLY